MDAFDTGVLRSDLRTAEQRQAEDCEALQSDTAAAAAASRLYGVEITGSTIFVEVCASPGLLNVAVFSADCKIVQKAILKDDHRSEPRFSQTITDTW
jgi:hypothetical protein